MQKENRKLPELLAPAGSPDALKAAVAAGADAVYFGGAAFSNRMRAKNFSAEELGEAIEFCHSYGVKCYLTVNTRVRDIEMAEVMDFCRRLAEMGADAFIVADLGIAARIAGEILPRFPHLELHASTQMSHATALDGEALHSLGFSRMVVPRELNEKELREVCARSPIEIEMFVHGAHCVSYSGQCLMSWAMGGRSGNRGECAQPCRMMYTLEREKMGGEQWDRKSVTGNPYPLSLKDMCLASHIPEIIDSGVASLKIEGRQKSAAYVYGVTTVYRRLLDERRNATAEEVKYLDSLFSRDGFTDGYFTGKYGKMLGVRPEDAVSAEEMGKYDFSSRTRRLSAEFILKRGIPAEFSLTLDGITVSVLGNIPEEASAAAVTEDSAAKNLTKFGGTPYALGKDDICFRIEEGLYYPVSGLNALRRDCLTKLTDALAAVERPAVERDLTGYQKEFDLPDFGGKTCEVMSLEQVTDEAMGYFDKIYVPLKDYEKAAAKKRSGGAEIGINLPAVFMDELKLAEVLGDLKKKGCRSVMVHTLGQLNQAKAMGYTVDGSFRLNLTNSSALETWYRQGLSRAVISPELKPPAIRDLSCSCSVTVYGRIPLMLTKRCFVSDGGCSKRGKGVPCKAVLTDRKGERFPVFSENCSSVICNSRVLWMADRLNSIPNMSAMHFMFTDETADRVDDVIRAYKGGEVPSWVSLKDVRRL